MSNSVPDGAIPEGYTPIKTSAELQAWHTAGGRKCLTVYWGEKSAPPIILESECTGKTTLASGPAGISTYFYIQTTNHKGGTWWYGPPESCSAFQVIAVKDLAKKVYPAGCGG